MTAAQPTAEFITAQLEESLKRQRSAYALSPVPSYAERRKDLLTLRRFILENREELVQAVSQDYGHRSRHETLFTEIFPTLKEIEHTLSHLKGWMRPQRRAIDRMNFLGASNRVIPQPLGVVGVIVPWNFPINLTFIPLTQIFAAGNRAMVKMSENSRHLSRFLIQTLPRYFPNDKLEVFEETGGVGICFSKLPYDHLLFTGSGQTGRAVMAAAAANLVPVTLELGGKAPALVADDFNIQTAAERLLFVKCLNAGQICTTVDHVFVPEGKVEAFVQRAREVVSQRYADLNSPDYTSIIDRKSFDRIVAGLEEAKAAGATLVQLVPGPAWDANTRKIAPHIVLNLKPGAQEAFCCREIFGPVLPVYGYSDVDAVVKTINAGPRPLAFYPFTHNRRLLDRLLDQVMSGGVSVNDALFHVAQNDLPFGGVGESGMGHYHGREGFETFSKLRPVFHQARWSAISLMFPPYKTFATKYLDFLTK